MKHTSFPSREDLIDQCNTIKRRQERIIQVRLQSKQMSATILEKVKRAAQTQCEEIENQVLSEIRNHHRKELEYSRKQYEKCISEINQQHSRQQINTNNTTKENTNKNSLSNRSLIKSTRNVDIDRNVNKTSEGKSTTNSHECLDQRATSARHLCKKFSNKRVKVASPLKFSQHVVIDCDADNDINKHTLLNFRKHSPEVKHLKSLQRGNKDENHSKFQKKPPCLNTNTHRSKLIQSTAVEERLLTNNKSSKTQIDEMYNNLVHDRIRILEQKDKILDRQTMFIPNGAPLSEKTPRFSEYFGHFHNSKKSSTSVIPLSNTSRNGAGINNIVNDMKRIERKKNLLKNELKRSNDEKQSKNFSSSEEKESEKKQNSPTSSENPTTIFSSDKKSPISNDDSSSKNTTTGNQLYPSPILKAVPRVTESSRELDEKLKISTKHRHCRRKLRSNKDIQITVSNDRKSMIANVNDNVTSTQQHYISSSSSTNNKDFLKNLTPPVKLVVNVLPSADCKIEIKNNNSDKRYVRSTAKQNTEKVKDWRTLFKNQDKLTESSYYSPPECNKNVYTTSFEEHKKKDVISRSRFATKSVGYYVRKLLLMSPESIENLDVSSCDTTLVDAASHTTSIDTIVSDEISTNASNELSYKQISTSHIVKNGDDDSENIRQLLLKCLKLATAGADCINLSTFNSIDSSRDNKTSADNPGIAESNDSNVLYKNFINVALQRLLPLYQNSLDNNLDCTTQSTFVDLQNVALNRTEYESEIDESKTNDDDDISVSAYLQKFFSSLSAASEQPDKYRNVKEYLKQYIEQRSFVEKSRKIPEQREETHIYFPSVQELIQKGLISESCALNETQNEPKEFLDEEEFVKKMLQVDLNSKEFSHHKDDAGPTSKLDEKDPNYLSESVEKYSTDIGNELRRLGLNWMNTTWQRTLQASIINSTSSAEDSAGPLRNNTQFLSNHQPSLGSSKIASHQQPPLMSREFLNISPIAIPDLQLSIPDCFRKN